MTMHPSWTDPAYWKQVRHWIEIGYSPRPARLTSAISRFRFSERQT